VDIGYVGSQGHRLKREGGLNIPQPGPGNSQLARPWQNFGFVQHTVSIANSNYNGLQAKIEKRMSGGVTVLSAYTYSKSIDNTSGIRPGAGDVIFPANPFNLGRGERGMSSFDVRHRWVTSALIESPVGKNKRFSPNRFADAVLESWQIGGIFSMQTGSPLTPVDNNDVANIGNGYTDRPNVTGISRKLSHPTPQEFFNTAAFVPNPAYTFGNAGRNSVEGPGLIDLDMSLMKSVPFGERVMSQFRWDLFNVANHPIFGLPNNAINSTAFGTISSTIVDSREMQVSLRIVF
jgi:hypothetical protein